MRYLTLISAVTALSLSLPAQLAAGTDAPEFKISAALNGGPTDLSELNGKAVLLELFATW